MVFNVNYCANTVNNTNKYCKFHIEDEVLHTIILPSFSSITVFTIIQC